MARLDRLFVCGVLGVLLVVTIGCATGGGGGGGGGGAGDDTRNENPPDENINGSAGETNTNANTNANDDATDDDGSGAGGTSAGAAAFAANGCTACHITGSNDFSESTVDTVTGVLVGAQPHPDFDFAELSDRDFEDITDFVVNVLSGEESLEGATTDGDDANDNTPAEDNENGSPDDNDNAGGGDEQTQAHAWFEQVWSDFDGNYSHFGTKDVDWDAARQEYEPRFQADLTAAEFVAGIAEMLATLRDLHVWVFDAGGETVEVYSQPAAQNYPDGFPGRYYPDGVQQWGDYPLVHGWMSDNLAYILIDSFESDRWDDLHTGEVDDLFAAYADADGMVIDVRSNNGGNEIIARTLAGHLTDTEYVYGYHRNRTAGPDHEAFGDFEEHRLEPAENQRFAGPVACLIGETNLSSAEWFVLMMLENPHGVTLVGDTTRGSSGNPQRFAIDGVMEYYIPSWEAYRADRTTRIEDVGIPPTTGYAITPEASYSEDRDFVLEKAVELLTD